MDWFQRTTYSLFGRKKPGDDEMPSAPEGYLDLTVKCMQHARTMVAALNFNAGQCEYLVDKLEVAVESVRRISFDHADLTTLAHYFQVFKFLFSLATEVESFIQVCCEVAWIRAAVSMTNVSKHVSFLGFNLEVFRIIFPQCLGEEKPEFFTPMKVADISKAEEKTVKYKATLDDFRLLRKLEDFIRSSSSGRGSEYNDLQLALFVVERLQQSSAPTTTLESPMFDLRKYTTYMKEEPLGKGAFATVSRGVWLGVTVAKKTFGEAEYSDFQKELSNFARLSHPNIVRLFGYESHGRRCSIVMDLMDGNLCELVDERVQSAAIGSSPFTMLEAIDMMHQIGEGVLYLHEQRIVHRDLKSENILFKRVKAGETMSGYVHVKVADLGVSKIKEMSRTSSEQTKNVGTSRWMAPEMISMGAEPVSLSPEMVSPAQNSLKYPFKCDIYSFALICYQIISGKSPFSSIGVGQLKELKRLVLSGSRPPEFETKESAFHRCPTRLKTLIERCWNQDPGARPSFRDICEDLRYLKCLSTDHLIGSPSKFRVFSISRTSMPGRVGELTAVARNLKTEIGRGEFRAIYYEDLPDRQEIPVVVKNGSRYGEMKFLNHEGHLFEGIEVGALMTSLSVMLSEYIFRDQGMYIPLNKKECKRIAERFRGIENALMALMTEHSGDTFIEISTMEQIFDVLRRGERVLSMHARRTCYPRNVFDGPGLFAGLQDDVDSLGVFLDIKENRINRLLKSVAEIDRGKCGDRGDGDLSCPSIPFAELKGLIERKSQAGAYPDGPVLLLECIWNGWKCAVKVFKSAENREQLHEEIACLVKLRHPVMTQLIGCAIDGGKTYVVTEMMDSDLRAVMTSRDHERPFSRTEEMSIIMQIAKGMFYLHEKGLVHGELECCNVLVREVGDHIDVKFGNSHWGTKSRQVGQASTSQNVTNEGSDELLMKRDVLSFAITCYEVVTGNYLFEGKGVEEEFKAGVRPKLPMDLKEDLRSLITKCWHEDPEQRPSFQDICFVLKDIVCRFDFSDSGSTLDLGRFIQEPERPLHEIDDELEYVPRYLEIRRSDLTQGRPVGRGASSEIFVAGWMGYQFAVKWFEVDHVAKFRQEVRIMMKLVHPHVIRLVGFSVNFGAVAIVMELMDGSLRDLMDHRIRVSKKKHCIPFSISEALGVIRQVAMAMDFLHSRGVAHGDLKSTHVMVQNFEAGSNLVVKLAGFGSSHLESLIESKPSLRGRCLAPEVIVSMESMEPVPYDPKPADVFSFGMMCVEVFTGSVLYEGFTSAGSNALVKAGILPEELSDVYVFDLKALVVDCLCLEPQERFTFPTICERLAAIHRKLKSVFPNGFHNSVTKFPQL